MNRKTVPILMGAIAALLIALVIIIVIMLSAPDRRDANARRRTAVNTLLSGEQKPGSLSLIAAEVASPIASGGSLDNLLHFLGKDPGRSDFPGAGDRNRAKKYLDGNDGSRMADLQSDDIPGWAPSYINSVSYLFSKVEDDIFTITGYPDELTYLDSPVTGGVSALNGTENAISMFSESWVPSGESLGTYSSDRETIRAWLMNSRRFRKRMMVIESSWNDLLAKLYNLSVDARWHAAVAYAPGLKQDLDELILVTLSADIYRRNGDVMTAVKDSNPALGDVPGPGIVWIPEMSYYKNIPELTGYTSDETPFIFFAKVSVAYTFRDSRTQTWLNRRKDWLSDYFGSFFSSSVKEDFSPKYSDPWKAARLKAEAIHGINMKIVATEPFGVRKVYGVREVAFVRVNLLANP